MKDQSEIERLEQLIKQQIRLSKKIESQQQAINRKLKVMVLGGYARLLIVLIPIILGIIYIPSFISEVKDKVETFQMLPVGADGRVNISNIINSFSKEDLESLDVEKLLKNF